MATNFREPKAGIMTKVLKKIPLILMGMLLAYIVGFVYQAIPIISGYNAKVACSCMFNSKRSLQSVTANELSGLPFSLAKVKVDLKDSSVTSSVFGLAVTRAIYREGAGCTLFHQLSEDEVRAQNIQSALPMPVDNSAKPWPLGNQHADTMLPGIDTAALNKEIDYVFLQEGGKRKFGTRGVIVLVDGKILAEKYADGFDATTRQTGWSMTKSINNALVGILVKEGKLSMKQDHLFKEWEKDERSRITLDNLLHANSGLQWEEQYFKPSPANMMLFTKDDAAGFARNFPLEARPGTLFEYSSGTANIISNIIRQKTGSDYYSFARKRLFDKLGMSSVVLEPDASGTFVGSSFCYATARDWARFGLLYLNDGVANGERLLPEGWVKYTCTPSTGAKQGEYGAQFWLNAGAPGNAANRTYPSVPTDCFYAEGFEGQEVWIVPSERLVVVRLSLQKNGSFNEDKFLAGIIKSLHRKQGKG